jgi:hypothetical protein
MIGLAPGAALGAALPVPQDMFAALQAQRIDALVALAVTRVAIAIAKKGR